MNIEFYKKDNKESPVTDFIFSLENRLKAKVIRTLETLEEFGNIQELRETLYTKSITGKLWEIKIDNIRLFYTIKTGEIWILHGFIKKTDKTPIKEINIAKSRL